MMKYHMQHTLSVWHLPWLDDRGRARVRVRSVKYARSTQQTPCCQSAPPGSWETTAGSVRAALDCVHPSSPPPPLASPHALVWLWLERLLPPACLSAGDAETGPRFSVTWSPNVTRLRTLVDAMHGKGCITCSCA